MNSQLPIKSIPIDKAVTGASTPGAVTPSRLPSLDGWRAVSIFIVLGFHCTLATGFPVSWRPAFRWFFDGSLGVRFFFVISGFLITWLLLGEFRQQGTINLRRFYLRRSLRILPVYFTFIAVLAALQALGIFHQDRASWIGILTFTRNAIGSDPVSSHLWSLSIEEQFYLFWPGLLILATRWRRDYRTLLLLLLAGIILSPVIRGLNADVFMPVAAISDPLSLPPLSLGRVMLFRFLIESDALAVGCLGAVLYAYQRDKMNQFLRTRPLPLALAGLTLIALPHVLTRLYIWPIIMIQFGNSLQAFGFALLLLQSITLPAWGGYRLLNWAVVRWVGVLSYSIYIWQQLFWGAPKIPALAGIWWMGLWAIPLLIVSVISYNELERPLLNLRNRYRPIAAQPPQPVAKTDILPSNSAGFTNP